MTLWKVSARAVPRKTGERAMAGRKDERRDCRLVGQFGDEDHAKDREENVPVHLDDRGFE